MASEVQLFSEVQMAENWILKWLVRLMLLFTTCTPATLAGLGWSLCCRPACRLAFGLWTVVFVAATLIAYFRCKKRGEDFAQSVFDLFMSTASSKPATDKTT